MQGLHFRYCPIEMYSRLPAATAIATILMVLVCAGFFPERVEARVPKVYVVNSYHAEHPWVVEHNGELMAHLDAHAILSFAYLDTKRLPPHVYEEKANEIFVEIAIKSPDVVVLTDDHAVMLLGSRTMALGIPVVFLGVNQNPRTYLGRLSLATGVLERPLYKRSLFFLQDILEYPLQKCLIVFDAGTTSQVIFDTVFHGKGRQVLGRTQVEIMLLPTFAEWKKRVLAAEADGCDIVFVGLYHSLVGDDGSHVSADTVVQWTSEHSPVPVFAYWDFSVGKGKAVGGLVNSGIPQGEEAAKLVRRILDGEQPGTIYPVTAESGRFLFSRHELKRWSIEIPQDFKTKSAPISFME